MDLCKRGSMTLAETNACNMAITLDASVFGRNSWSLETGLLRQLRQFRGASVQFILSEVVANELRKYLTTATKKAREELDKATRESCKSGLFTVETSKRVVELVETAFSSDDRGEALQRIPRREWH